MKGFYTQAVVLLYSETPQLATLRWTLESRGYRVTGIEDDASWPEMSGPSLTVEWRPGVNGRCLVDITDSPWPDGMGGPKEEGKTFGAWAMGAYGPCTHPGGLERAVQFPVWPGAGQCVASHRAFVRVRTSYAMQGGEDARVAPPDYDATAEVCWLLEVAATLLGLEGALAFFNPGGELLLSPELLEQAMAESRERQMPPIQAVVSTHGIRVDEHWWLGDTVGLAQLDMPDFELSLRRRDLDQEKWLLFPLNLAVYMVTQGVRFETGHTTEGPEGELLRAEVRSEACYAPPRQVVHWGEENAPPEPEDLRKPLIETNAGPGNPMGDDREKISGVAEVLHEMLDTVRTWTGRKDEIKRRAAGWLQSKAFDKFYDDQHTEWWIIAIAMTATMLFRPSNIPLMYRKGQREGLATGKRLRAYRELGRTGEVWFVSSVIGNTQIWEDTGTYHPALVLAAASQEPEDVLHGRMVAETMAGLYLGFEDPSAHPKLAGLMSTDEYQCWRRRAVPADGTDGLKCVAMDIMLRGDYLPPGDLGFIPVLAAPGGSGAVVQIPWHVITGTPPPMPQQQVASSRPTPPRHGPPPLPSS